MGSNNQWSFLETMCLVKKKPQIPFDKEVCSAKGWSPYR